MAHSYGMKHMVERWLDLRNDRNYIGNEDMIEACRRIGFSFEEYPPNRVYGMSLIEARKDPLSGYYTEDNDKLKRLRDIKAVEAARNLKREERQAKKIAKAEKKKEKKSAYQPPDLTEFEREVLRLVRRETIKQELRIARARIAREKWLRKNGMPPMIEKPCLTPPSTNSPEDTPKA